MSWQLCSKKAIQASYTRWEASKMEFHRTRVIRGWSLRRKLPLRAAYKRRSQGSLLPRHQKSSRVANCVSRRKIPPSSRIRSSPIARMSSTSLASPLQTSHVTLRPSSSRKTRNPSTMTSMIGTTKETWQAKVRTTQTSSLPLWLRRLTTPLKRLNRLCGATSAQWPAQISTMGPGRRAAAAQT